MFRKKISVLFIVIVLFLLTFSFCYGEVQAHNDIKFIGEDIWLEFNSLFPDRVAFGEGEALAGEYIANKFKQYNLDCFFAEGYKQEITYAEGEISHNIIAIKKSANPMAKTIIIGAHYDNVVVGESSGANDNASGVAVLLSLADEFSKSSFDFNIVFACFALEELGLLGSQYFLEQLTNNQLEDILLYLNLDVVANGDSLYLYAEDISTDFETIFLNSHNQSSSRIMDINSVIGNNGIFYSTNYYNGRPFMALYQNSDALSFRNMGIPSVSFFAGNLDYSYGYLESSNLDNVTMHTINDTVTSISSFGNEHLKNMQTVYDCIVTTFNNDKFLDVALSAKNELVADIWYNSSIVKLVVFLIFITTICIFVYVLRKMRKRALLVEQPVKKFRIFFQPNDEEVFTF